MARARGVTTVLMAIFATASAGAGSFAYADPSGQILAGVARKGFSVALPRSDRAFLFGRYTIPERATVGTLEPLDVTPPRLTLKLDQVAPQRAEQTVRVRVVATAADDYDPAPRLALESFIPDDGPAVGVRWSAVAPPSRLLRYTVTYSATDASGNTARASIKVTVPNTPADKDGGGSVMLPTARLRGHALIP